MKRSVSRTEPIDRAEEMAAGVALALANTKDELVSIWWRDCDHFEGDARQRLQDIYADKIANFAPMQRAG